MSKQPKPTRFYQDIDADTTDEELMSLAVELHAAMCAAADEALAAKAKRANGLARMTKRASEPKPTLFIQDVAAMTDDEIDDLAVVLHAAMVKAAQDFEAARGNRMDDEGNVFDSAGRLLNGE